MVPADIGSLMTPPSAMTMWPGLPGAAVDASGSASVRQGQICPVLIIAENKAPVLFTVVLLSSTNGKKEWRVAERE